MVIPFGATIQKDKIMGHYTRWLELKEEHPGKYARDIAGLMHISAGVGGGNQMHLP